APRRSRPAPGRAPSRAGYRRGYRRAPNSSWSLGPALPFGPQALEAAALRRRQVAHRGPALGERQRAEPAALMPGPAEQPAGDPGERMVERRALRHPGPQPQPRAVNRRAQPAGEFPLAPVTHHPRQRDLDRADALAAAAEGR